MAAGPGSRNPGSAGTAWGARRGHRGHGFREHRLIEGREGGQSESCSGQGGGEQEGRQGAGSRGTARAGGTDPGGSARTSEAGQRGREARAFCPGFFQAGRLPPFPLPEFSFSVGEAPAQLEGEGVGEGVPGAGCPWPLWPDTPLPPPL